MFCVDTGDRGFPGPPGQKGDRGQSLSVPYQKLSYVEPRIYRFFVNAAFNEAFFFFPQEITDMPEGKGRLDLNHRGPGHMELDSSMNVFLKLKIIHIIYILGKVKPLKQISVIWAVQRDVIPHYSSYLLQKLHSWVSY